MASSRDTRDLERYRRAAEESLSQLDWCVGFLYRIGKTYEADGLAGNRRTILQGLQRGAGRESP